MSCTTTCYLFSDQYTGDEYMFNLIYPTQLQAVKELISRAKNLPSIQYLVLFGSSITPACGHESDIDLLVIADQFDEEYSLLTPLRKGISKPMDIIPETLSHFKRCAQEGNTIYNEILQKGIVIYERTPQTCQV
ncbi:MAG: nucleotidyltransferase domain-containing protein [Cellulosilyticaceae bacterium]